MILSTWTLLHGGSADIMPGPLAVPAAKRATNSLFERARERDDQTRHSDPVHIATTLCAFSWL
jgi:hypothetical protein